MRSLVRGAPVLIRPDAEPISRSIESADDGAVTITKIVYQAAPDELLPFPFGLEEEAAAKSLVRTGKLRAVKIGRRLYARRSDVLSLVDTLAEERQPAPSAPPDSYAGLVAQARRAKR